MRFSVAIDVCVWPLNQRLRVANNVCRCCGGLGHVVIECTSTLHCRNCAQHGKSGNKCMVSEVCPIYSAAAVKMRSIRKAVVNNPQVHSTVVCTDEWVFVAVCGLLLVPFTLLVFTAIVA